MRTSFLSIAFLVLLGYAFSETTVPSTFKVSANPFDRAAAAESIYRTLGALDNLKRYGQCGNATIVNQRVADLNTTLSSDFEYYHLNTTAGVNAGSFDLLANRSTYLSFMQIIAVNSAYHGSQHSAVDLIISFSSDGHFADITGRYIEYGDFLNGNGNPNPEESQSDFSVLARLERIPAGTSWPYFGPVIDTSDRTIIVESAFRPIRITEQGNMRKSNGIVRDFQRNFCPGSAPDASIL